MYDLELRHFKDCGSIVNRWVLVSYDGLTNIGCRRNAKDIGRYLTKAEAKKELKKLTKSI